MMNGKDLWDVIDGVTEELGGFNEEELLSLKFCPEEKNMDIKKERFY